MMDTYHDLPTFYFWLTDDNRFVKQTPLYVAGSADIAIVGNHVIYEVRIPAHRNIYGAYACVEEIAADLYEYWDECHVVMMLTLEEAVIKYQRGK